jgi:hypothetical protein
MLAHTNKCTLVTKLHSRGVSVCEEIVFVLLIVTDNTHLFMHMPIHELVHEYTFTNAYYIYIYINMYTYQCMYISMYKYTLAQGNANKW